MKKRLLAIAFSLCFIGNIFPMEEEKPSLDTKQPCIQTSSLKKNRGVAEKSWSWFITYLKLSHTTKKVSLNLSKFDPAVRIYDKDTNELVLTLQRITHEGTNTNFPDRDVSFEGYNLNPAILILLKDKGKKILSLEVGGEENKLLSYDEEEKTDLTIKTKENFHLSGGLIRLSPSFMYNGNDYKDFFKTLRKNDNNRSLLKEAKKIQSNNKD